MGAYSASLSQEWKTHALLSGLVIAQKNLIDQLYIQKA